MNEDVDPNQVDVEEITVPILPPKVKPEYIQRPSWTATSVACTRCDGAMWQNKMPDGTPGSTLACKACGFTRSSGVLEEKLRKQRLAIGKKSQKLRNAKKGNRP